MRSSILVAAVLVAGIALAGTVWLVRGSGNDALLLNPDALDFGVVTVGEEMQQVAIATNTSGESIAIDAVRVPEGFRASRDGVILEPGESAEILVVFRADEPGEVKGELVLESDARRIRAIPLRALAQLPPAIEIAPRIVSFGEVGVGRSSRMEIVLTNRGDGALRVDALVAPKPFRVALPNLEVPAGESRGVEVRFAPEEVGDFEGFLAIRSNDPERRSLQVPLEGTALAQAPDPRIEVNPLAVDFGRVTSCSGPLRWVSVRNGGADPLTLAGVRYPEGFIGPSRSRTVPPGREFSFPVTFAPRSAGAVGGELKIFSNDPSTGVVAVRLSGNGVACGAETIARLAERRPSRPGSNGFGGPDGIGFGGGPGGRSTEIAGADPTEGGDAATDPGDEAPPPEPGAFLEEDSVFRLASYSSRLSQDNVNAQFFDPDTGRVVLDITPPVVDAALGEFFQSEDWSLVGNIDRQGDFSSNLDIVIYDPWGNPIEVTVEATTREVSAVTGDGQTVDRHGKPFGPDGRGTIVFLKPFPSGSTLDGQLIWGEIHVQLNAD